MVRSGRQYLASRASRAGGLAAAGAIALVGAAVIVNRQAAKAEKANPPQGSFVNASGIRLHYIERGQGKPVVFLHGNGMLVEDMLSSGILDAAAARSMRAIAVDGVGFGLRRQMFLGTSASLVRRRGTPTFLVLPNMLG